MIVRNNTNLNGPKRKVHIDNKCIFFKNETKGILYEFDNIEIYISIM